MTFTIIALISGVVSAVGLFIKLLIVRSERNKERAASAEAALSQMAGQVEAAAKRHADHAKTIEKILSGVSAADAGGMLSSYPDDPKVPDATKAAAPARSN